MCYHDSFNPGKSGSLARFSAARLLTGIATVGLGLGLTACSATDGSTAPEESDDNLTEVTFALDWAPNTNHIGIYVAEELGYFEDAGLDVQILPYGSTNAMQLVSAGEADFGIGGQSAVQMARTSGLDVVSVYSITQTDAGRLVTLGDRDDITRPGDLDGLVFGGFGAPLYSALASATITGDGGSGDFTEVVLDTGAYEALSHGSIDFTLSVATWEDVQATIEGRPYQEFRYQDYGVPDQQSSGIVSSTAFVESHREEAAAFVQAVGRGYNYTVENPEKAAEILIAANPDTLGTSTELVHQSTDLMAAEYLSSSDRPIGEADPSKWEDFGSFLYEQGFLVDSAGKPVTEEPDWSEYFTNDLLD
mgnify:FL=1